MGFLSDKKGFSIFLGQKERKKIRCSYFRIRELDIYFFELTKKCSYFKTIYRATKVEILNSLTMVENP